MPDNEIRDRETKARLGSPSMNTKDLFRLDRRTILSELCCPVLVAQHLVQRRRPKALDFCQILNIFISNIHVLFSFDRLVSDHHETVTGGGGAMGLEIARSVLESGGDVICFDRQESPLVQPWGRPRSMQS